MQAPPGQLPGPALLALLKEGTLAGDWVLDPADRIQPSGAGIAVTGALTVRDRTRALSFDPAVSVPGDGEIWLNAEVRVNRADFGLTWNRLGMVSPTTTVIIHAVFTRQ